MNVATRASSPGCDEARERHRALGDQRSDSAARQYQPGAGANRSQHAAFRDQLAQQPGAPRAERGAHGNLAASGFRTREQQIRHVRTGDQQHERNRRHQRLQRRTQRADELDIERAHFDGALLVGVGMLGLELLRDAIELALRGAARHAWFQAASTAKPRLPRSAMTAGGA